MSYLLGIDIGTSGTKTLICSHTGRVVGTAVVNHDISSPKPGWSEQNPLDWWNATCRATRAVLRRTKVRGNQITGIGLSGQMHGSVFLGRDERPLRPALLWNDQRTAEECAIIEQRAGGRRKLINMVGNPALTGFTAPKILWVRKHEPKVYDKTCHILLPKDYIRCRMTGEYATDVGDASGTLLFDVRKRAWSKKLLTLLGIDPALLPVCYESHEISGKLSKQSATTLGLVEGTPVVGGSGDQPAGAVGNGIVTAGSASATLGTSGVVFVHSDQPTYDPKGRVHTMCHAVAGKWCVFGCMLSAGGSFQWFRNHLSRTELAAAKRGKVDPYELLIKQAATAPPGCEGLFFLPYLTGERCPYPNPNARGGWIGLTMRHGRPALIRSLVEGVTFGMADTLKILIDMGIGIRTVRLSGGGARSSFWRQLQADIYNKPVVTINAQEGPAYGAAILSGVGTGIWKGVAEACRAVICETEKRRPNRRQVRLYKSCHVQYQNLYASLTNDFNRIAALPTA